MKKFLDANIILEELLPGRLKAKQAANLIGKGGIVVSPLTAHLCVYIGTRDGLAIDKVTKYLKLLAYTPFGGEQVLWAINNRQDSDFEDALQVACAVTNGCDQLYTLDKTFAKNYKQFIDIQTI